MRLAGDEAIPRIVRVLNPTSDYVPPGVRGRRGGRGGRREGRELANGSSELVSLFITNAGGHNPSYIYRLLAEYYRSPPSLPLSSSSLSHVLS
eukprot:764495-Hanusia_phi.AAC.4